MTETKITEWYCKECGNRKEYVGKRAMVICPACMSEMFEVIKIKKGGENGQS